MNRVQQCSCRSSPALRCWRFRLFVPRLFRPGRRNSRGRRWGRGHLGLQKAVLASTRSVCDIYKKNAHPFFLPCWAYVQFPLGKCCCTCASAASPLAVGGHFSCEVIWCPPVFHTPPSCRWLLQELVGTNYRGTCAIYCHLLGFFFVAWKWKAISSFL